MRYKMKISLFKVYARHPSMTKWSKVKVTTPDKNAYNKICFARSYRQAAEIAQEAWEEAGLGFWGFEEFQVIKMIQPQGDTGLIAEPNSNGRTIKLPIKRAA